MSRCVPQPTQADVDMAVAAAEAELPDRGSWPSPVFLDGLGLCVMNAVYSTRNHSSAVVRVLDRYRERRREQGPTLSATARTKWSRRSSGAEARAALPPS